MEVGADVWYKCKNDGWSPANIIAKIENAGQSKFTVQKTKNKEEFLVVVNKDTDSDSLKLMNTAEESEVENLINLPFLHEPAILYCLELRYFRSQIYTYTGPILIAVNPFKKVDLYSDQLLAKYYNSGLSKAQGMSELGPPLAPHPYAIADAAYRLMMGAIQSSYGSTTVVVSNQSILISGESGAGKTESTKIVLRYLTTVASETLQFLALDGTVMDKVLKSNPILEALGNAKTIRNDNSSRFGKFIELNFDKRGHLIGGFIRTYLLEKIRLTSQQSNERCFHIFYQVAAGGTAEEKTRWDIASMNDFYYANQGKAVVVEKLNDKNEYADLRAALDTLRFGKEEQVTMLDIIAGILHLGQIKLIPDKDGEGSELGKDATNMKSLATALRLLGLPEKEYVKTVTERTIVARNEKYQKKLTSQQASDARDSMARVIYGKLFDWVVATINKEIKTAEPGNIRSDIGVLDIFGFECLKENSFEQLCINYTNETLQQQFNQFVFKMEQEEYTREGIEWSFVSFPDNQDCIDLIDLRKKSIFSVLDDECLLAGGTDAKFASRMSVELGEYERFSVSPAQKTLQQFSINHYAGEVVYFTASFVDKNRDELPKEATELMGLSSLSLLQYIFSPANIPPLDESEVVTAKSGRSTLGSPTICTQFKAQLGSLMSKIQATKPHYIRCLKPNDQNKPDSLSRVRTTEQLRYGGVLEAVRVARSGFPVRLSHEEFYARYRPLANPFSPVAAKMPRYLVGAAKSDALKSCSQLLEFMWDDSVPKLTGSEKNYISQMRRLVKAEFWKGKVTNVVKSSIQLGKTKVFFRKQAHDFFEGRRSRNLVTHARSMQAGFRGFRARIWYRKAKRAVFRLQLAIRYFVFHRKFVKKRRLNACLHIQTAFRCHLHLRQFKAMLSALLSLQKSYRGLIARRTVAVMLRDKHATRLQACMRMLYALHRYTKYRKSLIALQCKFRIGAAKQSLKDLRIAARDIGNLKQNNEVLKREIEQLRSAASQATTQAKLHVHEEQEVKLKDTMMKATDEIAMLKKLLEEERCLKEELEVKLISVEATLVAEMKSRNSLEALVEEKESMVKEEEQRRLKVEEECKELEDEIIEMKRLTLKKTPTQSQRSSIAFDDRDEEAPETLSEFVNRNDSNAVADGINEEKLAEILSDYVSIHEHDRIVKTLNDEAAILRKTIANSGDAQQELLKQFQKRKSIIDENSGKHDVAGKPGALKAKADEIRRGIALSFDSHAKNGSEVNPHGSMLHHPKDSEAASLIRQANQSPVGSPALSPRHAVVHSRSPTKSPTKSPSKKSLADEPPAVLKPEFAELIKQVSYRGEPASQHSGRPKSLNATALMKSLKTTEAQNALLQSDYGDQILTSSPLPAQKEVSMTTPTQTDDSDSVVAELGYRASPHPDHFVPKKATTVPTQEELTPVSAAQREVAFHQQRSVFDQNLESFKTRLVEGFLVVAYTPESPSTECVVELERPALIKFTPPPRRFSLFARKAVSIPSISVFDISEICNGLSSTAQRVFTDITESQRNEGFFVTITFSVRNGGSREFSTSKFILLKFPNQTERNALVTGFRSFISEIQLKMSGTPMSSTNNTPVVRKGQAFTPSSAPLSEDEPTLRANYEMLIVQLFILSNDLNERELELIEMRKREEILQQHFASKEKLYEQDAIVRMQLGKRLEQVLMDKEEVKDQLEQCKAQLEQINQLVSGASALTPGGNTGSNLSTPLRTMAI